MTAKRLHPGLPAPYTGIFEEIDLFGVVTGAAAFVKHGEPLPGAPRGFMWRPLGELSVAELRRRAAQCRHMAATARTRQTVEALLDLGERLDAKADQREQGEAESGGQ